MRDATLGSEPLGFSLTELSRKRAAVIDRVRTERSIVVALSGGVDSAVLLALCAEALGPQHVTAVTGHSAAVPVEELEDARCVAEHVRVPWRVVETRELDRPEYRANRGDRCFHCRTELFELLAAIADADGCGKIAYGAIVDDLGDDRPGMRAAQERGILAPLLEAGITKEEVRHLAAAFELPVRDKPASPCLASRIPAGTEVTPERLHQIETAERALRRLGFVRFRVRHHGDIARIQAASDEQKNLLDPAIGERVREAIRAAGFRHATVDLEPLRSPAEPGATLYSIDPARPIGQ